MNVTKRKMSPEEAENRRKVETFLLRLWKQTGRRTPAEIQREVRKQEKRIVALREYVALWESIVQRSDTKRHREGLSGWVRLLDKAVLRHKEEKHKALLLIGPKHE